MAKKDRNMAKGKQVSGGGELVIGSCEATRGVRAVAPEPGDKRFYRVTCDDRDVLPSVVMREGAAKWNLSPYVYLAVDVTNPGAEEIVAELRLNEIGAVTVGGGTVIPPGETRTILSYLIRDEYPKYLDEKLFGMFALPARPGIIKTWAGLHTGSLNRFSVVLVRPPRGTVFLVGNARCEDKFAYLTEEELGKAYFPFVDEFGQFRHKEWPGKIHSADELARTKDVEARDVAANPPPGDWNKYGGWLGGPQLKATGHFRTEKVRGKWWLVDPEGRLFWSHGIGMSVTMDEQATPITEREHYFADLPDPAQAGEFYRTQDWTPQGYYKGRSIRVFNRYTWNLMRKFGPDWKKEAFRLAGPRLKSWGMNTSYSWSPATVLGMSGIPYASLLRTRYARKIEGSAGYWGKFPDPFDKSAPELIVSGLAEVGKSASDPYCIGYFVDNEMDWGDDSYLGKAVVQSPKDQPAKQAALELLKAKYGTVDKLNAAWHVAFRTWDDLLENTTAPAGAADDLPGLSDMVARHYFKVTRETLRKHAPSKLYLGCRFHDHYYPDESSTCDWVVKIAAEYCDVVSFNRYRYSAIDLRPSDADVPVLIGEWHMGALDRGMLHYTLRFAQSQEHRAELYRHYLKSCLQNPFIVGAHWFEYGDEPVTGRFDGENFNTGFIDVCDQPYPEMVSASRTMGKAMYAMRF